MDIGYGGWLDRPGLLSVNNQRILTVRINALIQKTTALEPHLQNWGNPDLFDEWQQSYNALTMLQRQKRYTAKHIIEINSLQQKIEKMHNLLKENDSLSFDELHHPHTPG